MKLNASRIKKQWQALASFVVLDFFYLSGERVVLSVVVVYVWCFPWGRESRSGVVGASTASPSVRMWSCELSLARYRYSYGGPPHQAHARDCRAPVQRCHVRAVKRTNWLRGFVTRDKTMKRLAKATGLW